MAEDGAVAPSTHRAIAFSLRQRCADGVRNGRATIASPDIAVETSPAEGRVVAQGRADAARAPTAPEIPSAPEGPYGAGFFEALAEGTRRSAAIVTLVLIEMFRPGSDVDVGCGTGFWLAALLLIGVAVVFG